MIQKFCLAYYTINNFDLCFRVQHICYTAEWVFEFGNSRYHKHQHTPQLQSRTRNANSKFNDNFKDHTNHKCLFIILSVLGEMSSSFIILILNTL